MAHHPSWAGWLSLLALWMLAGLACSLPALSNPTPTPAPPSPTPPPPEVVSTPTLPPILHPNQTPGPGLLLRGYVHAADGSGVANVEILRGYAAYPPVVVATSNADGYFESALQPIPGDEMVWVSARLEGFTIRPDEPSCGPEECSWRHYYGYEERVFYFMVTSGP